MKTSTFYLSVIQVLCLLILITVSTAFCQIEEEELNRLLNPAAGDSLEKITPAVDSSRIIVQLGEMVHIPAGNFIMGSNDFEFDERPEREVFVEEFWIDQYPVTNSQYAHFLNEFVESYSMERTKIEKFINLTVDAVKIINQNGYFIVRENFEQHPVVCVTWIGAERFARFYGKRLPTEAEWEKAARGINGQLYPWGNEIDSSRANYWDSKDPFNEGTTPVGFYNGQNHNGFLTSDSRSPFGAYDMVDNVKEWVADWYLQNYYSQSTTIDPVGPEKGVKKVARGGGYLFHAESQRASIRYALEPNKTTGYIGFRCARSTAPEKN